MADELERDLEELVQRFARDLARDITALLLRRLGIDPSTAPRPAPVAPTPAAPSLLEAASHRPARRAPEPAAAPRTRRARSTNAERERAIERVAEIVGASSGLSLGEIERAAGLPRPVIAGALKSLKDAGRVFMGGTKRLARYATTLEAAERASEAAARK